MGRIKTLHIHNFKFFDEQNPIKLDGKHLLLFGENGSGKSSIYWSLYNLFQASLQPDIEEIKKYFKNADTHPESLINIYSDKITEEDGTEHYNSYVKVVTMDDTPITYQVSFLDTGISENENAKEVNLASDFINYKVLYKFQDFWNDAPIDLAQIFEGYVLPYINFPTFDIWRNSQLIPKSRAIEMWEEIKKGPGKFKKENGKLIQVYKYSKENQQFERFADHFDRSFKDLIDFININAPIMLKKLGYDIDFSLNYHEHTHKKGYNHYYFEPFRIDLKITSYLGKSVNIHRPQSFLNEAKITAIAIAIRLAILKKRINEQAPNILKFIVFDDVMISLDMNNRDKLIDFILNKENKFTEDYQLLFLTHDKNLYDFVTNKIKQWDRLENWVFKEMYAGENKETNKEHPIIIDSALEFIDKAKKYYNARDYTACSIYIRKELEKLVNERLPSVLKQKGDGNYLSLQTLWGNMEKRYEALRKPISPEIKKCFAETKLMILNPQAHFQDISLPIYKVELDKAFDLIEKLKADYPIPQFTILLSKGMVLQFKHPLKNYTFDFELLSDFYVEGVGLPAITHFPKCRIIKWQYDDNDFWDFTDKEIKKPIKPIEQKLNLIKARHIANISVPLDIDNEMFDANIKIENSIWSFKEVIDKAGVTI